MTVLEFVAEEKVGLNILAHYPEIAKGLRQVELQLSSAKQDSLPEHERIRLKHLLDLCFEYDRENDSAERQNIASTVLELVRNEELELPRQNIEEWEKDVGPKERFESGIQIRGRTGSRRDSPLRDNFPNLGLP